MFSKGLHWLGDGYIDLLGSIDDNRTEISHLETCVYLIKPSLSLVTIAMIFGKVTEVQ